MIHAYRGVMPKVHASARTAEGKSCMALAAEYRAAQAS
jgi:hypothetical protein